MEPEGSLTCSQDPAISAYPNSDSSRPHLPSYFPEVHSIITSPSTPRSFERSLPFRLSDQNFVWICSKLKMCQIYLHVATCCVCICCTFQKPITRI